MDRFVLTQQIKAKAQGMGFSLVGVTRAEPPAQMTIPRRLLPRLSPSADLLMPCSAGR